MYGMKIRYTTNAEGQVGWIGNDTILIRKIQFSMVDIRKVVHGLVNSIRQRLVEDLFMFNGQQPKADDWRPVVVPRFDISAIADNYSVLDEA